MAAAVLRAWLDNLVTSMFPTGLLDENFHQLKSMEEDGTAARGYVADMINLLIKETKRILNDIAALLSAPNPSSLAPACVISARSATHPSYLLCFSIRRNQPVVDYDMVDVLVRQLKGCSYSVGAKKVNISCMQFRLFYEPRSKERCLMALALAWNEFCDVRSKFETMMQLEEQIAGYGPN